MSGDVKSIVRAIMREKYRLRDNEPVVIVNQRTFNALREAGLIVKNVENIPLDKIPLERRMSICGMYGELDDSINEDFQVIPAGEFVKKYPRLPFFA